MNKKMIKILALVMACSTALTIGVKHIKDYNEKDIIEYTAKLSQFKTQVGEQKQQQESNKPKCPHCKSTNIKSISGLNRGASIAMWGIFSKKINKSFECLNCKYTW